MRSFHVPAAQSEGGAVSAKTDSGVRHLECVVRRQALGADTGDAQTQRQDHRLLRHARDERRRATPAHADAADGAVRERQPFPTVGVHLSFRLHVQGVRYASDYAVSSFVS